MDSEQKSKICQVSPSLIALDKPTASSILRRRRAPLVSLIKEATKQRQLEQSHHRRCQAFKAPQLQISKSEGKASSGLIERQSWDPAIAKYFNRMDAYHFTILRRKQLRARMLGAVQSATARRSGTTPEAEVGEVRDRGWEAEGWRKVEEPEFDYFSFPQDPKKERQKA